MAPCCVKDSSVDLRCVGNAGIVGKKRGKLCWESRRGLDVIHLRQEPFPISGGWFVLDRVALTSGVAEDRKSLLDANGNQGSQITLKMFKKKKSKSRDFSCLDCPTPCNLSTLSHVAVDPIM